MDLERVGRRRRSGSALLVVLAVALACRAAPRERAPASAGMPAELADALGFDAAARGRGWRAGDRALWSVRLLEEGRTRTWSVGFRAEPDDAGEGATRAVTTTVDGEPFLEVSRLRPVTATVLEEATGTVSTSRAQAPASFLERGFVDLGSGWVRWRAIEASGAAISDEERRAGVRTFATTLVTLSAVIELLQSVECLRDVLWTVLDKPSWVSVLLNLGVELEVVFDGEVRELAPDALPPAFRDRPAYSIPLTILLNGEPALECRLTATAPDPPLALVAGVVRIEGWRAADPSRRVELELVGARLAAE